MIRRAHGEGTVYREGDRWVARIDLPAGADGRRRQVKRRRQTKTEAHKVLRELQSEATALVNSAGASRTVADAVDSFLRVQPADRAPKTVVMERWRASMIVAGLGARRLEKLSVVDCDGFLVNAASGKYGRRPLGRDATRRLRSLLVSVIRNEQRTGAVTQNVAELSLMPTVFASRKSRGDEEDGDSSTSVRRALTKSEYLSLSSASKGALSVLIELCGRNGLRPSEARALKWDQVDFAALTLSVRGQMSTENEPTMAKTRRSVRTVPIDEQTVAVLQAWSARQHELHATAQDRWRDLGLVVTTKYGTGLDAANFRRTLTAACDQADIDRFVPYELRHTAITYQIEAGHDTWTVADWAGTSEKMIEEIYRHRLNRVSKLGPVQFGQDDGAG